MQICLIQVPYTCGDAHHDASKGADHYVQAGVERLLTAKDFQEISCSFCGKLTVHELVASTRTEIHKAVSSDGNNPSASVCL